MAFPETGAIGFRQNNEEASAENEISKLIDASRASLGESQVDQTWRTPIIRGCSWLLAGPWKGAKVLFPGICRSGESTRFRWSSY